MKVTPRRAVSVFTALGAAVVLVACSSSSSTKTTGNGYGNTGTTVAGTVTASAVTADFSAMAQLKSVAGQGKGKIADVLPDTPTLGRYEQFDRPYMPKEYQAAGLTTN